MSVSERIGWDGLRHGGLLLDPARIRQLEQYLPKDLSAFVERELRRKAGLVSSGVADSADFVAFVLQEVCGFGYAEGSWQRGPQVGPEWNRRGVAGDSIKPRMLWSGTNGGRLPVFFDTDPRVGIGRGRRTASQVLQWLRAGSERLALLTNGQQWRLIFAGLDFDAWVEWDTDLWFEEGGLSTQITGLRTLVSPTLWTPTSEGANPPLLQSILDSRKGQSELSAVLGERVREAVELLVQAHGETLKDRCADVNSTETYRAAVRVVMRAVVIMFAESRELLPRDNALYHGAYGLGGLLEELQKIAARGGNRLARSWNAWPRVLALFRLVHDGSHHPALPVPRYGGELFAPGDANGIDGLSRALAVFENACFDHDVMSDRDVHAMLMLITRTKIKLRQGRSSTWVSAPVDFSDLSSEYIGILYEGLLDFELKTAPADDPVIFLAVGNQPALPLSRLEAMEDQGIANLLEKMKDTSKADDPESDSVEDMADIEASAEEEEETEAVEETETETETVATDKRHETRTRAEAWARRAVVVGKLVRKPTGTVTPERRQAHEEAVSRKARQIVTRVMLPGEWYLVRWGGTRKGSGTFYTRPGLAVPTVQRTLRPLAYDAPHGSNGEADRFAPAAQWTPKTPEQILALRVCDPACGSGTFPVAALRFLTDALYASLHKHGRITPQGDRALVRLLEGTSPAGDVPEERLGHELLPATPDSDVFEPRLKAILRRYVVERCIYGVDLDPLAVELCRLALWIETMDRTLPFSFLDHKIKVGNSLVGAWFDTFQHYPVMAWKNREGGDKNHSNGVHFTKDERGKEIKHFTNQRLKPNLQMVLGARSLELFDPAAQTEARRVHDEILAVLARMHNLGAHESPERARIYRHEVLGSEGYRGLKEAFDVWSAIWFWPVDQLEYAPLPNTLSRPSRETRAVAAKLSASKQFFHWELEFPDVFGTQASGFDAMLGNPPWDIAKPSSKEFFSNIDPLYRSYGKTEALEYQKQYFVDERIERSWLDYSGDFRAQSNYVGAVASPFGDPIREDDGWDKFSIVNGKQNAALHESWRKTRKKSTSYADPAHAYQYQGSADLNLYKLFLEQSHALLKDYGRLGFIVPSGLYSDLGTGTLRKLFLDSCRWEWLFGFENRDKVFDIDSRFKFNPIVLEKRGKTQAIQTAFMRRRLEDWDHADEFATAYKREQVERFSPRSRAILEIQSQRDLEILEKIYANSVLLGDDDPTGWGISYATEFHMTNDAKLFPTRPKWEEKGHRPDEYSRWLKGEWRPISDLWTELAVTPLAAGERRCAQPPYNTLPIPRAEIPPGIVLSREADAWIHEEQIQDTVLPLYEGRMIGQFDFSQKGWVSGKGRSAVWRDIDWVSKHIEPQFMMSSKVFRDHLLERHLKGVRESSGPEAAEAEEARLADADYFASWWLSQAHRAGFMDVTSATNTRTVISTILPCLPCGNKVPVLGCERDLILPAILSSFPVDWEARRRMSGLSLNYFILAELALPLISPLLARLSTTALALAAPDKMFATHWLRDRQSSTRAWRLQWAITEHERVRRLCMLNALCLSYFDLTPDEADELLGVSEQLKGGRSTNDPKGFWRVDKEKDFELRTTVLTLAAFIDLHAHKKTKGGWLDAITSFTEQNDGDGWLLPESLSFSGSHLISEPSFNGRPVADRFGDRFVDWQLAQAAEESWRECELHARNTLGARTYDVFRALLDNMPVDAMGRDSMPLTVGENRPQYGLFA